VTPANIAIYDISLKTRFCGIHFRCENIGVPNSTTFTQSAPKGTEFGEITLPLWLLRRSRSRSPSLVLIESSYATSYLAPFLRYSVRYPKSLYSATPLVFNSPDWGVPLGRYPQNFTERSWMAKVPNGVETLPKISIAWVGRTKVTDDRQQRDRQTTDRRPTDGRRRSRSLKTGYLTFYCTESNNCRH